MQPRIVPTQMLVQQERMLAARERQMVTDNWLTDQLRKAVPPDEKTARRRSDAHAKRGWPVTRVLFWTIAAAVGARLLLACV
jgi:hypothetical protein